MDASRRRRGRVPSGGKLGGNGKQMAIIKAGSRSRQQEWNVGSFIKPTVGPRVTAFHLFQLNLSSRVGSWRPPVSRQAENDIDLSPGVERRRRKK
ncbi:Hypothetical protein NTJ_12795 [Nesidiocoris tenuis]|uniref:Uncharacterized protein n=1 Tax=Nesidiocoris tenuis TaxID=355587 RepID=A0ABN7B6S8_9HEMI|nr:Hypothetical protein NTJ_12795 [Nesidiocoris tenuis]